MNDDRGALLSLAGLDPEDRELARDCMRSVRCDGDFDLEVAVARWRGQEPALRWNRWRRWKRQPDTERIGSAVRRALAARRYFRRCDFCGRRCNVGHMTDLALTAGLNDSCREQCRGCAEALGVVFRPGNLLAFAGAPAAAEAAPTASPRIDRQTFAARS